jgi:hypothetical protein
VVVVIVAGIGWKLRFWNIKLASMTMEIGLETKRLWISYYGIIWKD